MKCKIRVLIITCFVLFAGVSLAQDKNDRLKILGVVENAAIDYLSKKVEKDFSGQDTDIQKARKISSNQVHREMVAYVNSLLVDSIDNRQSTMNDSDYMESVFLTYKKYISDLRPEFYTNTEAELRKQHLIESR